MGKNANARAWAEFERLDRLKQDKAEVLSEEARAAEWDIEYYARLQDEARGYGVGEWA
jgi:hypothetical protein